VCVFNDDTRLRFFSSYDAGKLYPFVTCKAFTYRDPPVRISGWERALQVARWAERILPL
jgi:hypothetical protein